MPVHGVGHNNQLMPVHGVGYTNQLMPVHGVGCEMVWASQVCDEFMVPSWVHITHARCMRSQF
jgi:hypothetical protein